MNKNLGIIKAHDRNGLAIMSSSPCIIGVHYTYLGGILRTRATILRPVVVGLLGDYYSGEKERDLNVWNESKLGNSSRTSRSIKHACLDGLCRSKCMDGVYNDDSANCVFLSGA